MSETKPDPECATCHEPVKIDEGFATDGAIMGATNAKAIESIQFTGSILKAEEAPGVATIPAPSDQQLSLSLRRKTDHGCGRGSARDGKAA